MIRFSVFSGGEPAGSVDLCGAYVVGSDHVPIRADIALKNGQIQCGKRTAGPAALAILWPVPGMGKILLETTRLPERETPYVLQVELLRGRLMRMVNKVEEWQQFDGEAGKTDAERIGQCRAALIEALKADGPAEAAAIAERGLAIAVETGEDMVLRLARDLYDRRRRQPQIAPRRPFGCTVDLKNGNETYRRRLTSGFDFATIPFSWQELQPSEQQFNWKATDSWVEWLAKNRIPVRGSSLVSFEERHVPPWLYVWEHDFETLRDLIYDHVRRVVHRYGAHITTWDVISGIHACNCLSFNFEQLMELTRMSVAVAKQVCPRATVTIDLVAPWGEYYARNQRTIPPLLYADMAIQSGVNFDAFGLQFYFGVGVDGMYVRDFFQIATLLDRFAALGKPLHVTAVQVPSGMEPDKGDAWGGQMPVSGGGMWREEWSEQLQSRWLRSFYELALSKPMIESVTWRNLSDQAGHYLPNGGLLRADLTPKPAYEQLLAMRKDLLSNGRSGRAVAVGRSVPR
ncbi:MAG: endo-1,4-beta-xylanase [Phycisphaerales bacterium]|nr:MAG: endo-1,4-beta-xylanase [Phycisphaerales bacterium]